MARLKSGEIGASGTVSFDGFLDDDDYNSAWNGKKKFETIEEMRKGDATVKMLLEAIKLPILAANWFVEPASEDDEDKFIAAFVSECLFEELELGWNAFLSEALGFLDFGFYVFEEVYQDKTFENRELIGLKNLAPRLPRTIEAWETEGGELGVQQFTIEKGWVSIPWEKLAVYTHEREGEDYEGESLLRPAYPSFYYKNSYYKVDAIAAERQGVGIPRARKTNDEGGGKLKDDERTELENVLRNIRANEQSFIIEPDGITIDWMKTEGKDLKDGLKMIMHHDTQILKAGLAQFLNLGTTGGAGGSRALSGDHQILFNKGVNAIATNFQDATNKSVVKRLVDLNFVVEEYPKLDFERITNTDIERFSGGIKNLLDSKAITQNVTTEKHIRNELDLPNLTDEEEEKIEERQEEDRVAQKTIADRANDAASRIKDEAQEATEQIRSQRQKFVDFVSKFSDSLTMTIEKLAGKDVES